MLETKQRPGSSIDLVLIGSALVLAGFGVVMIYTASRGAALSEGISPSYYAEHQVIWVVLGVLAMVGASLLDYRRLEHIGMIIYWLCVLALLGVLVPGIGSQALGSQRWYSIGSLQIQPSEFAVLALVIAIATYCSRRNEGLTWGDVGRVLILGGIPIALVVVQPDLGTGIIMAIILLVMLAVAGLPNRILALLLIGSVGLGALAIVTGALHQYEITRITSFLHQDTSTGTQIAIYNLQQAKNAIGAGGMTGTGIGHGAQTNLGYVPEQQTDFIFTAVGEQLGFVGAASVLGILALLAWRVLRAGQLSRDVFGRLLCVGAFTFLAFSTFQNAGMTMGIMPITGIPLPFLSYGGTAVLCFFLVVGTTESVYFRRSG